MENQDQKQSKRLTPTGSHKNSEQWKQRCKNQRQEVSPEVMSTREVHAWASAVYACTQWYNDKSAPRVSQLMATYDSFSARFMYSFRKCISDVFLYWIQFQRLETDSWTKWEQSSIIRCYIQETDKHVFVSGNKGITEHREPQIVLGRLSDKADRTLCKTR